MPPHAAQSLAVAAAFVVGSVLALLLFDAVLYWLLGHTATVSHGMWRLGLRFPWLPWAWTVVTVGLSCFLRWHFWAR